MNKISFSLIALLSVLLASCDEREVTKSEIVFLTVQSSTSIKDDLMKLVAPYEDDSIKNKIFVSYPLYVERLDLNNSKVQLDYETNKGVNYDKIAAVKRDFNKFFDKQYPDSLFQKPANKSISIDNYLSMPNVFLYSSNPSGNQVYNGKKVYSDIAELKHNLSAYVMNNKGKAIIIYNAVNSANAMSSENPAVNTGAQPSDNTSDLADCNYEYCITIKKKLLAIGTCNGGKTYEDRFKLANAFVDEYISEASQVELLSPEGVVVGNYSGKRANDYVFELANEERCVTEIKIPKIDYFGEVHNGKIKFIRIRESDEK